MLQFGCYVNRNVLENVCIVKKFWCVHLILIKVQKNKLSWLTHKFSCLCNTLTAKSLTHELTFRQYS